MQSSVLSSGGEGTDYNIISLILNKIQDLKLMTVIKTILWFRSPFQSLPKALQERLESFLSRKEEKLIDVSDENNRIAPYTAWSTDNTLHDEWIFVDITPAAGPSPEHLVSLLNIKAIMTCIEEIEQEYYGTNYESFQFAQELYITETKISATKLKLPLIIFFMSRSSDIIKVETLNINLPIQKIENSQNFLHIFDLIENLSGHI